MPIQSLYKICTLYTLNFHIWTAKNSLTVPNFQLIRMPRNKLMPSYENILRQNLQNWFLTSTVTRCWTKKQPKFYKQCPKRGATTVLLKTQTMLFTGAQKIGEYLSNFCWEKCCQELEKIAQSGHTAYILVKAEA